MLGSNGVDGKENGRIDGDSIVKESSDDLLHEADGFGRQKGGIFVLVGILDSSAIDGLVPGKRGILGAGECWILELVEGLLYVCGHGYVTSPFVVVPIKGETTIEGAIPVDGDSIQLLEILDEMVSSFFADVFYTEVVKHEGEEDISGGILPKGRGLINGVVSKLGKVDMEPIVCNVAGLFQAWHAFADLQVHQSVGYELEEVALGNDFFRNYIQADIHILISRHRDIVIKYIYPESVNGHGGWRCCCLKVT